MIDDGTVRLSQANAVWPAATVSAVALAAAAERQRAADSTGERLHVDRARRFRSNATRSRPVAPQPAPNSPRQAAGARCVAVRANLFRDRPFRCQEFGNAAQQSLVGKARYDPAGNG